MVMVYKDDTPKVDPTNVEIVLPPSDEQSAPPAEPGAAPAEGSTPGDAPGAAPGDGEKEKAEDLNDLFKK
jgi:hypothetical protein